MVLNAHTTVRLIRDVEGGRGGEGEGVYQCPQNLLTGVALQESNGEPVWPSGKALGW